MTKTVSKKYSSSRIKNLLANISTSEKNKIQSKMELAARIEDLILARGWNKSEFAEKLNRNPSEITKWLSGTHNFTIDTLSEIATVLNVRLAELFTLNKIQIVDQVSYSVSLEAQSLQVVTPLILRQHEGIR
jgi:transcriptional regulator with XRE-family HTH domain